MTADPSQVVADAPVLWGLAGLALGVCDAGTGLLSLVNPSLEAWLGRPADELLGRSWADLVAPTDAPAVLAAMASAAVGRVDPAGVTARFLSRGDEESYGDLVLTPVATAGGVVQAVVGQVVESTSRVRAERVIADREQQFRLLAENTSDIVMRLSPEGVFQWVSGATEQLLGWAPEELVGVDKLTLRHPDDLALGADVLTPLLDGSVVTETDRIRCADGSYRWMNRRYRAILDDAGAPRYLIGSWRDGEAEVQARQALAESEREARELALRYEQARDEARAADSAKTLFLSRMSHELRTPLNAVLGFTQLLGMSDLSADQRESVQQIRAGGRHLLSLINEVLDIARIEAGRLSLSLEDVVVADVVAEATDLVVSTAESSDVELVVEIAHEPALAVWADRQRVIQVLLNLMSNAVKYNRPGGQVTVRANATGDSVVAISVTDTGRGISEADMPRLFQPFDRLGAEAGDIEGTGIGLTLSQGLALAMNGSIDVQSSLGTGSTFTVRLPQSTGASEVVERVISAPVSLSTGAHTRVLYIEDNSANTQLMQRILQLRSNATLTLARDGRRGLELALAHPPDLLLLDLHLPDLSGEEVLRELRADPRTADVVIVVITADASADVRLRVLAAGADGHLSKPVDVRDVLAWIDDPRRGGSA